MFQQQSIVESTFNLKHDIFSKMVSEGLNLAKNMQNVFDKFFTNTTEDEFAKMQDSIKNSSNAFDKVNKYQSDTQKAPNRSMYKNQGNESAKNNVIASFDQNFVENLKKSSQAKIENLGTDINIFQSLCHEKLEVFEDRVKTLESF